METKKNKSFEDVLEAKKKELQKENNKITYNDLKSLVNGFGLCAHLKGGANKAELSICISKNFEIIDKELKVIDEVIDEITDYKKFKDAIKEVQEKYANKGPNGKPLIIEDEFEKYYDIPEDKKQLLNKEIGALEIKYKQAIKERNDIYKKETDIELHKINSNKLPGDITPQQTTAIHLIIRYTK